MADISQYLTAIMQAVYGEDVRGSIHDAIEIINDVSEVVLSTGTAVSGPTSSSTGFFEDSLYLNTSTYELWKCVGTNTWQSQGIMKGDAGDPGADGVGIADIQKTGESGLVDEYTIYLTDGYSSYNFYVTNGTNGNKWYIGTGVSGTSTNPTVFVNSGVTYANVNDCYLNNSEGRVFHCVTAGDASTATWVYDFTMTGGGGGGSYTPGTGIDISAADVISIDPGTIASGVQKPVTGDAVYTALSGKQNTLTFDNSPTSGSNNPVKSGGIYTALSGKQNTLTFDNTPTSGSNNPVKSDGIYTALSGKQATLTFDDTPTSSSNNPVKSGGIYTALSGKAAAGDLDEWGAASTTVSSGTFSFSGLDDTHGYAFKPYINVDGNSTNKNPTAQIASISGAGTSSMTISYTTDADNGATVKIRIIK